MTRFGSGALHTRLGAPSVCAANVSPLGSVSVKVTAPFVTDPPLLLITTLYAAVPPRGRLIGAVFDTESRGTVFLVTVQSAHEPVLLATVLLTEVTPSASDPTVTTNDLVTETPAPMITSCV